MHRRLPTMWALFSATLLLAVVGCDDTTSTPDPLADISSQYRTLVQNRQLNRESADQVDDTAAELRTLATRAESAGRSGDGMGAAVLASGIRSSAATFEAQEALRLESKTNRLRSIARQLITEADLLGGSAESAENLDLSDVDLYLESELSGASERVAKARRELEQLNQNRDDVVTQQQARLDRAREQEAAAVEVAREGVDRGPLDGFDSINESIQYRQVANRERIAAARDEISVQTLTPTIALANTEASGQAAIVDSARQARENAQSRRTEADTFAQEVRGELAEMASMVNDLLSEISTLEDSQVLPRLDAAIADYEAAANASRPLTRGTKMEKKTGWRGIANAQLGLGRTQWDRAVVLARRADLLTRLASSDILMDSDGNLEASIESINENLNAAIESAKAAFNDALASLGNITDQDATTARTQKSIQTALKGLDGESMQPEKVERVRSSRRARGSRESSGARNRRSGPGFSSPAEAAQFLSDPTSQMVPANLERLEDSILASSKEAKGAEEVLTVASFMAPLFEAMERKFSASEVKAAMGDGLDLGEMDLPSYKVQSSDDDRATLKTQDGRSSLILVKDDGRWFIDLDETIDNDPQLAMMVQMIGPMLKKMTQPMKSVVSKISKNIRAGDYPTAEDAMKAFQQELEREMQDAMGGSGGGGGGGGMMGG